MVDVSLDSNENFGGSLPAAEPQAAGTVVVAGMQDTITACSGDNTSL